MHKSRRIEITMESKRLVFHRTTSRSPVWCPHCPVQVALVTPDELAVLAGVSTRTIYRWVEAEQVHFCEMTDGHSPKLLVCPNSLPQF